MAGRRSLLLVLPFLFIGIALAVGGKARRNALLRGGIVPDVVSGVAPKLLDLRVYYKEFNKKVVDGCHLKIAETQTRPHVEAPGGLGRAKDLWTLLMVDPDAPSPADPVSRNFLHWEIVNIPGSTTPDQDFWKTGYEAETYLGPAPPMGTHRYVFLLFKQKGKLSVESNITRSNFDVKAFTKKNRLGLAKGGLYYTATLGDGD